MASWGNEYAIGVMDNGVNTKLAGTGANTDIIAGQAHRLAFRLTGTRLELYDNAQLVLSTTDPTLIPATSYVGLQTTQGRGQAKFAGVLVETLIRRGCAPTERGTGTALRQVRSGTSLRF